MGAIVYTTVQEHVNKHPYEIHDVPATYGPVDAYFFDKNTPGPIFQSFPGEKNSGRYTIAALVDMYFNNVSFTFNSVEDMLEIEKYLGTYIAVLEQEEQYASRENLEYLNRARKFFRFLKKRNDTICHKRSEKYEVNNPFYAIINDPTIRS